METRPQLPGPFSVRLPLHNSSGRALGRLDLLRTCSPHSLSLNGPDGRNDRPVRQGVPSGDNRGHWTMEGIGGVAAQMTAVCCVQRHCTLKAASRSRESSASETERDAQHAASPRRNLNVRRREHGHKYRRGKVNFRGEASVR